MKKWWKFVAMERVRRMRERSLMWLAWHLPRPLVYWCAIRLGANATTGAYSSQVVPELHFTDALQRWEGK